MYNQGWKTQVDLLHQPAGLEVLERGVMNYFWRIDTIVDRVRLCTKISIAPDAGKILRSTDTAQVTFNLPCCLPYKQGFRSKRPSTQYSHK